MRGVYSEDRWSSCFYCGHVVRDEPTLAEKMESNAKKDTDQDGAHTHHVNRLAPLEAPIAVTARVLAMVRAEAAHVR